MTIEELTAKVEELESSLEAAELRIDRLENDCGGGLGIQIDHLRDSINGLESRIETIERND